MASGKSNFGRRLAEALDYEFVDLDYLFEERFRISVLDFFDKYDEDAFRIIERSLLAETSNLENIVISTGGGTPCFFDNMDVICRSGISIYLHWSIPALISRLNMVRRKRPLLKNIQPSELLDHVSVHLAQRELYYNRANIIVEGANLNLTLLLEELTKMINLR